MRLRALDREGRIIVYALVIQKGRMTFMCRGKIAIVYIQQFFRRIIGQAETIDGEHEKIRGVWQRCYLSVARSSKRIIVLAIVMLQTTIVSASIFKISTQSFD